MSDGLRVIRTIRGETAINAAKDMGLKLIELRAEVNDENLPKITTLISKTCNRND